MLTLKYQKLTIALLTMVVAAVFSLFLLGGSAQAQAEETQLDDEPVQVEQSAESEVPENFEYTAVECNNLTLLVRRSIQVYDAETQSVDMSPEAIIYAETNVVQELGSFQLDVGDDVTVPRDLVAKYAQMSADLTPAQTAAWGVYAANVNFKRSTADIQPDNFKVAGDNTIVDEQSDVVDLSDQSPETEDPDEDDDASPVWWLAGVGAVGLLWYVLWRRPEDSSSSN